MNYMWQFEFLEFIAPLKSRILVEMQNDMILRADYGCLRKIHIYIRFLFGLGMSNFLIWMQLGGFTLLRHESEILHPLLTIVQNREERLYFGPWCKISH